MTNRERLNLMSNAELAPLLNCPCCLYHNQQNCLKGDCEEGIHKWLESEVDE